MCYYLDWIKKCARLQTTLGVSRLKNTSKSESSMLELLHERELLLRLLTAVRVTLQLRRKAALRLLQRAAKLILLQRMLRWFQAICGRSVHQRRWGTAIIESRSRHVTWIRKCWECRRSCGHRAGMDVTGCKRRRWRWHSRYLKFIRRSRRVLQHTGRCCARPIPVFQRFRRRWGEKRRWLGAKRLTSKGCAGVRRHMSFFGR